jgi:hypothetical protein
LIRLTQDSANTVVITTTEKGSASYYLFQFFSLSTNINAFCIAEDTSPYPLRYNAFTITDQATPTAEDGEVDLATGEYKYYVFANSSSSNLDPSGLTELESGMCLVTGTEPTVTEYDNTATYTVYNG